MNTGSVQRVSYWWLVPLLIDGIRRRKNAVVHRAGFSNQAESFALGFWDESDNLAHVRLRLQRAALLRRLGWEMGLKTARQQAGKSEGTLPNRGKPGPDVWPD
jgi:hypothetical protein